MRFVRAHAEEYGIDLRDIAVMGFSAGGILSGEMLLNFDGNTLPTVLDPDYQPDELDQASADAAEQAGVEVERLQLDGFPHGFGASGDRIPAYDQWLRAVFAENRQTRAAYPARLSYRQAPTFLGGVCLFLLKGSDGRNGRRYGKIFVRKNADAKSGGDPGNPHHRQLGGDHDL